MLPLISISLGFKSKLYETLRETAQTLYWDAWRDINFQWNLSLNFIDWGHLHESWTSAQNWCFLAIFVSTLLSEKYSRPLEPSVLSACVARADTQPLSPLRWDCLTQAVHTKNSCTVCLTHTRTHMCWNTHVLPPFFFQIFLSFSTATTSVRWAVSTPKAAGWTPVITCLRSSGTQAARWSRSTSRPQVPQHATWDL